MCAPVRVRATQIDNNGAEKYKLRLVLFAVTQSVVRSISAVQPARSHTHMPTDLWPVLLHSFGGSGDDMQVRRDKRHARNVRPSASGASARVEP